MVITTRAVPLDIVKLQCVFGEQRTVAQIVAVTSDDIKSTEQMNVVDPQNSNNTIQTLVEGSARMIKKYHVECYTPVAIGVPRVT